MIASAAMALFLSLFVVSNSLRLFRFSPDRDGQSGYSRSGRATPSIAAVEVR